MKENENQWMMESGWRRMDDGEWMKKLWMMESEWRRVDDGEWMKKSGWWRVDEEWMMESGWRRVDDGEWMKKSGWWRVNEGDDEGELILKWSFYFTLQTSNICFDELIAYDNKCFISENNLLRRKFLKEWIQLSDSATCLAYDEHDNVVGCGCRIPEKDVKDHFLVGPLYADDSQVASMILSKLCSDVPGKFIDIGTRWILAAN